MGSSIQRRSNLSNSSVFYFGTIVREDGIRLDPAKVKVMVELPQPYCKEEVRKLMGTLNEGGSF